MITANEARQLNNDCKNTMDFIYNRIEKYAQEGYSGFTHLVAPAHVDLVVKELVDNRYEVEKLFRGDGVRIKW